MLPVSVILSHFKHIPEPLLEIALEVRNLVAEVAPDATERLDRDGMTYFEPKRGGTVRGGLVMLAFCENYVRLAFGLGAFLPDPHGLLRTEEGRKAKRVTHVYHLETTNWDALRDLIAAAHTLKLDGHIMANLPPEGSEER